MTQETVTGDDLRLLRVARRLSVTVVAHHFGVTRTRISHIESSARPTRRAVERYLAAVRSAERER